MIDKLKKNVSEAKAIVSRMDELKRELENSSIARELYDSSIGSLVSQLRIINNTIPNLLKGVDIGSQENTVVESNKKNNLASSIKAATNSNRKSLSQYSGGDVKNAVMGKKVVPEKIIASEKQDKSNESVQSFSYVSPSTKEKKYVTLNKEDRAEYLKELSVSERGFMNLKKANKKSTKEAVIKPSKLAAISNKFFRSTAEKIAPKFTGLEDDLKKANIRFLIQTYVAMMLFVTTTVFLIGSVFWLVMSLIDNSLFLFFWIPLLLTGLSLIAFYFYPASERSSVQKNILNELPFATIHMAAIAGAEIEPSKIFKIIATSPEYPSIGKEMKKIINHVEIYGYDIVTSLKSVAKQTSNKKLGELFSGLASNISSGGELKSYLEKKSQNYMGDYRLERQRYADLAGTFMDVYISILIAAPLVLMMLFIVMNVSGLGIGGLSIELLLGLSVGIVVLANIIFMVILQIKQPRI